MLNTRENMNKQDIKDVEIKLKKFFNVPIVEPLSDGVSEIVDFLEELNAR